MAAAWLNENTTTGTASHTVCRKSLVCGKSNEGIDQ
ncbi:Uncharacterised protein [Vibrio cholerae]|nr:Uncharacterised protein [Vibrio cholerae]